MLKGLAKRRVCVPPLASGARPYQDFGWDRFTGQRGGGLPALRGRQPDPPGGRGPRDRKPRGGGRTGTGAKALPWQARFDRLDTLFESIGSRTGLGWDIVPDFGNKRYVFTAWEGADRTAGDALCLISEENGNAADVTYRQLGSGSATTAYVGGAGEDENRFILCEGGSAQGAEQTRAVGGGRQHCGRRTAIAICANQAGRPWRENNGLRDADRFGRVPLRARLGRGRRGAGERPLRQRCGADRRDDGNVRKRRAVRFRRTSAMHRSPWASCCSPGKRPYGNRKAAPIHRATLTKRKCKYGTGTIRFF